MILTDRQTELNGTICKIADKVITASRHRMLQKSDKVIADVRKNRNWSWYREILFRSKKHPEATALFYGGNEISIVKCLERWLTMQNP